MTNPQSPPSSADQGEMERLLRAAYRDFPGFDPTGDASLERLDKHHQRVWENALAHLLAEKAKSYELGHSVGQHDATTGEDVMAAEAAALDRLIDAAERALSVAITTGSKFPVKDMLKLISPTSRTAYPEAIAAAEERGRKEGLAQGRRWRHKKRGSTYTEIGLGEMQCSEGEPFSDYELVMVYRCEADGKIWVRRKSEFEDGRFEEIDPPQNTKETQS